jgi:uncharacterized repeat protein (TIGR03803 family)
MLSAILFAATVTRVVDLSAATGQQPRGALMQASDGNFYGTTSTGGDDGAGCVSGCGGTVFKLTPLGQLTVLHTFDRGIASEPFWNGKTPRGGLVEGPDGWLYGTTYEGSAVHPIYGTVYKLSKAGQFQKIHDFCPATPCPDGANPEGSLAVGGDGWLYGTTTAPIIAPRIFRLRTDGTYQVIANFINLGFGTPANGVIRGSDGAFYGVTSHVIYKVTSAGAVTELHRFGTPAVEGSSGYGPLVEASDGNLYGTTLQGGANGQGTLFRISKSGTFQKIHDISGAAEGLYPQGVIQASDGNLWGMTSNAAPASTGGDVYAVNTAGTYQQSVVMTNDAGKGSVSRLIQAGDGRLYGTAVQAGPSSNGTVFVVDAGLGPPTPGEAGEIGNSQMIVTGYVKATGDVTVSYGASCSATDHHIVYGPLSGVATYAYTGQACNLGATGTATFNPGAVNSFWVIVGNTPTLEGSYGRGVGGAERPQQIGLPGCAYVQTLGSSCP